jgi:hypothetical protein
MSTPCPFKIKSNRSSTWRWRQHVPGWNTIWDICEVAVIIRHWHRLLSHHYRVTRFCFQQRTGTKTVIPHIPLRTLSDVQDRQYPATRLHGIKLRRPQSTLSFCTPQTSHHMKITVLWDVTLSSLVDQRNLLPRSSGHRRMDTTGTDTGRWKTRTSQETAHLKSAKFMKQQISPSNTVLL